MARLLIFVICAGGLGGCFITEPDDLLDVVVRLPDSVTTAGVWFAFQVHVTNRASHDIEVDGNICPPRFAVFAATGGLVRQPGVACLAIVMGPVTLGPGESYVFWQAWFVPSHLPVGEYRLLAWTKPVGGDPVVSLPVSVRVRAISP